MEDMPQTDAFLYIWAAGTFVRRHKMPVAGHGAGRKSKQKPTAMKWFSLISLVLLSFLFAPAQNQDINAMRRALDAQRTDTGKIKALIELSGAYQNYKPDTALELSQQALLLSKNISYIKGESWSLNQIAGAFSKIGNYPKALEYYLEQLKIEEKINDPYNMAINNMNIANVFQFENDRQRALVYARTSDSIIEANNLEDLKSYIFLNLGDIYEKNEQLDSALAYSRRAWEVSDRQHDGFMTGSALNNLANVYAGSGEPDKALTHYHMALPYLEKFNNEDFVCESTLGLAKLFDQQGRHDSAEWYARRSLAVAGASGFQGRILNASAFLSDHFRKLKQTDSALRFLDKTLAMKDSIYGGDKERQLQILAIDENLRQKELKELKIIENEERKQRLQLLAIGIFIPVFFLFTVFLSRRKINPRIIESIGILCLLLLFEYLTLLVHPKVAETTHHSPVLEIIVFVGIAAVLTPAHHRIERWLLRLLTHKKTVSAEMAKVDDTENNNPIG